MYNILSFFKGFPLFCLGLLCQHWSCSLDGRWVLKYAPIYLHLSWSRKDSSVAMKEKGESLPQQVRLQLRSSLWTLTLTWHVLSTALVNAGDWTGTEDLTVYSLGCQAGSYHSKLGKISITYWIKPRRGDIMHADSDLQPRRSSYTWGEI